MDFLAFLTTWFWYLMAFAAGAVIAWLVVRQFVPARTPQEAIDQAVERHTHGLGSDRDDHDARDRDHLDAPSSATKETYR